MELRTDQPELVEEGVFGAASAPMNLQAIKVVYTYLQGLAPEALQELKDLNTQFSGFLPTNVQVFEKELEYALSTFISLDPLVQQLISLLPTA